MKYKKINDEGKWLTKISNYIYIHLYRSLNQISNDKTKARARLRIWVVLSNWILNDVWWFRNWQFVLLCLWKMSKTWENNLPQPSDSDFTFPVALLWKRLPKISATTVLFVPTWQHTKKTLWSQIWKNVQGK